MSANRYDESAFDIKDGSGTSFETIETTPDMTEAEDELSSGQCLIGCLVLDETFRSSEFDVY